MTMKPGNWLGQTDRSSRVILGDDACLRGESTLLGPEAARVHHALDGGTSSVVENRLIAASRQHKDGRQDDDFLSSD
jgi:hypothetical protein